MVHFIPNVKELVYAEGFLSAKSISGWNAGLDSRVETAVKKLPQNPDGVSLEINVGAAEGESYTLDVCTDRIAINAAGPAGAFYAIQTLRQLFTQERVPCLHIEDRPDFPHRGFYHDVTRGKIPNMESLKELIDRMAYYKLNSLQLYVEHTFEFEECKEINEACGYLTKEELRELDAYCRENFIDFIPSISTFGHMYEVLQQPKYQHLRATADDAHASAVWYSRMIHHTVDPRHPESLPLVQSRIDQYAPCFQSEWFNICCDETFDLHHCAETSEQTGQLYVDFVKKIIEHTRSKGKKVMMWADILLKYPDVIDQLPEDTCFLNWWYWKNPNEEHFAHFAKIGRPQIVCPGTSTWNRFCENVELEELNIGQLADFAQKYGAEGILNTNWGDHGNPCSLELAMYGLVLGAEKSWSASTPVDEAFYDRVDALLYENANSIHALKKLSTLHDMVEWLDLDRAYCAHRFGITDRKRTDLFVDLPKIRKAYRELADELSAQVWKNDEFRQEMLIAAEGVCVVAELQEKLEGKNPVRITDTHAWLAKYREKWLQKNKANEFYRIEEMLTYCEAV